MARTNPSIAAPLLNILCPKFGIFSITQRNPSLQFSRNTMEEGVKAELERQAWRPVDAVPE
jgi:hypothetical protein